MLYNKISPLLRPHTPTASLPSLPTSSAYKIAPKPSARTSFSLACIKAGDFRPRAYARCAYVCTMGAAKEKRRRRRAPRLTILQHIYIYVRERERESGLIYGSARLHRESYTRYHNTINSSSNSPLTESYWPRSKSPRARAATNVNARARESVRCSLSLSLPLSLSSYLAPALNRGGRCALIRSVCYILSGASFFPAILLRESSPCDLVCFCRARGMRASKCKYTTRSVEFRDEWEELRLMDYQ